MAHDILQFPVLKVVQKYSTKINKPYHPNFDTFNSDPAASGAKTSVNMLYCLILLLMGTFFFLQLQLLNYI